MTHTAISYDSVFERWKVPGKEIGDHDIFDHNPIWLKCNEINRDQNCLE